MPFRVQTPVNLIKISRVYMYVWEWIGFLVRDGLSGFVNMTFGGELKEMTTCIIGRMLLS